MIVKSNAMLFGLLAVLLLINIFDIEAGKDDGNKCEKCGQQMKEAKKSSNAGGVFLGMLGKRCSHITIRDGEFMIEKAYGVGFREYDRKGQPIERKKKCKAVRNDWRKKRLDFLTLRMENCLHIINKEKRMGAIKMLIRWRTPNDAIQTTSVPLSELDENVVKSLFEGKGKHFIVDVESKKLIQTDKKFNVLNCL